MAFRCSFDSRVQAAVCYFATDIHAETLALNKKSDSLSRCKEIQGELLMIFGKQDTHVPLEGRRLSKQHWKTLKYHFLGLNVKLSMPSFEMNSAKEGMMPLWPRTVLDCSKNSFSDVCM